MSLINFLIGLTMLHCFQKHVKKKQMKKALLNRYESTISRMNNASNEKEFNALKLEFRSMRNFQNAHRLSIECEKKAAELLQSTKWENDGFCRYDGGVSNIFGKCKICHRKIISRK